MKWLKKLTASEQNAITKTLESSSGLKITSIIIALLMFLTINQVGSPLWKNYFVKTGYIEGVPLTVQYDTDKYVISGIPQTVNVNITGSENNVQSVLNTEENLLATLQLNYKGTGNYTVSSEKLDFNNTANVKISPTVSSFDINVQERVTDKRSVDINYINGNGAATGYVLETPTLSTKTANITGGDTDVDSVVALRGTINLDQIDTTKNNSEQTFNVELVPYNASGEVVTGVSVSPKSVDVTQTYTTQTRKVPVKFVSKGNTDNEYVSNLCLVDNTECTGIDTIYMEIYGEKSKVQSTKYVEYQLDFSTYDEEKGTVQISPILESGVYSLASNPTELQAKINSGVARTIQGVEIKTENLQDGISLANELTTSVDVIGPAEVVDELTADDIELSVDLSSINSSGTNEVLITAKTDDNYNVTLPSYTIDVVTIKE